MTIILTGASVAPDWTTWASFYDHILPEVNGVTPAQVDFVLRQVCIEFCEQTGIHSVEVDAIDVVADTATYELTSPVDETEPYQIKAAWFDDRPMDVAPLDALASANPYWGSLTATAAVAYFQRQPDEIILYPIPDTAVTDGLRVEVLLRPTADATGLTGWVANRYVRQLAAGAKARLMAMPDRPWTRPDFAAVYQSEFLDAKTRAKIDANRSLTRATLSARPRPAA